MPCGKEKIERYNDIDKQQIAAVVLKQKLKKGTWFGFAEVDIEIPAFLAVAQGRRDVSLLSQQASAGRICAKAHVGLLGKD